MQIYFSMWWQSGLSFVWSNLASTQMFVNGTLLEEWLLENSGHPLRPWLMTPVLNLRFSSGRMTQCSSYSPKKCRRESFRVLNARFWCLDSSGGTFLYSPPGLQNGWCNRIVTQNEHIWQDSFTQRMWSSWKFYWWSKCEIQTIKWCVLTLNNIRSVFVEKKSLNDIFKVRPVKQASTMQETVSALLDSSTHHTETPHRLIVTGADPEIFQKGGGGWGKFWKKYMYQRVYT